VGSKLSGCPDVPSCLQVCAISVATSIIFFLMPVAGHCKTCDNQDEEHCIQGGWVTAAGLNTPGTRSWSKHGP
jgi:Zn-dependent alcohol dehydrogenase